MNEKIMQLMFSLNKTDFIFYIYRIFLEREPDTKGFLHYFKKINEPIDRIKMINDIIFSVEINGRVPQAGKFVVEYLIDNNVYNYPLKRMTYNRRCKDYADKLMRIQIDNIFADVTDVDKSQISKNKQVIEQISIKTEKPNPRLHDRRYAFILKELIKS